MRLETQNLKKIVFLDRDGVINRDSPNYIKNWGEFEFIPGSPKAIKCLTEEGFTVIVITNQSMINRGIASRETLEHTHGMMQSSITAQGGKIRDIFFCPHRPEEGCHCRKPEPGMLYQARDRYGIDLGAAYMVGDSAKDIQCAKNAGCGCAVLVRTGNGLMAEKVLAEKDIFPDHIAENLHEAAEWIIRRKA